MICGGKGENTTQKTLRIVNETSSQTVYLLLLHNKDQGQKIEKNSKPEAFYFQ
jgi:hypothetical protein